MTISKTWQDKGRDAKIAQKKNLLVAGFLATKSDVDSKSMVSALILVRDCMLLLTNIFSTISKNSSSKVCENLFLDVKFS